MANQEDMPPSLKITNCYNITLYDSTWNPGEDFEYRDYESDYSGSNTEDESYTNNTDSNDKDDNDNDEEGDENNYDIMNEEYDKLSQNTTDNASTNTQYGQERQQSFRQAQIQHTNR